VIRNIDDRSPSKQVLGRCFRLRFQIVGQECRIKVAEIAALADTSALGAREPTVTRGVYRGVFEQSFLLNQDTKRPWNFLASLSAELLVVSLALLIPLLYRDHLPAVHWKDITVGPAASAPPIQELVTHNSGATNSTLSTATHRQFRFDPTASPSAAPASVDFGPDAPPTLGPGTGSGGATNALGTFIPNFVAAPPPPKPAPAVQKPPSEPIRVTSDLQMAKLVRKIIPEYPPLARSARISGTVRLIGTIGKDGTIRNLQLVSGHPMLARAALEAVQQWIYKPTLLNGNPVEVIAPIEVNFTLSQ
jgi:protein TonB